IIIARFDYHQIKQVEVEGKNLEENEVRHPVIPDLNQDKDTKTSLNRQNNNFH
ncbi:MAG: hypothetical protein IMZ47_08040, partial [Firmicutes bacterium]|nr:hypothetical protein [Bacillota bacterium]